MAGKRDIIIRVVGDAKQIQPVIDGLEKVGAIDKKNAAQFKKNQKDYEVVVKKQLGILEKARLKEKQIYEARERSTNPKAIQRYNALLDKQRNKINEITGAASKQTKQMGVLNSAIQNIGATMLAAFSVQAVLNYGRELRQLAKQMEANNRKAAIVFGSSLNEVTEAAKENANAIGLSRNQYIAAASGVQDLLVPLGFARDTAAGMSTEITNLAGAMSLWTGGTRDTAEVTQILTKAMLGEFETLKMLGVQIDISSKAATDRIKQNQVVNNLTFEQARALDILDQIMRKSIDAQVSFATAQELIATKEAVTNAKLQEQQELIAEKSIPLWNAWNGIRLEWLENGEKEQTRFDEMVTAMGELSDASLELWKGLFSVNEEQIKLNDANADFVDGWKARRRALADAGVVFTSLNKTTAKGVETISGLITELNNLKTLRSTLDTSSQQFKDLGVQIGKLETRLKSLTGGDVGKKAETLLQKLSKEAGELKAKLLEQSLAGEISDETLTHYTATIEALEKAQKKLNDALDDGDGFGKLMDLDFTALTEIGAEDPTGDLVIFWDKKEQAFTQITKEEARKREQIYEQEKQFLIQSATSAVSRLQQAFDAYSNYRLTQIENLNEEGALSDEEYEDKKKQLLREQAEREKLFRIFGIITDTAAGVAAALKAGPVIGQILAAIHASIGAAQLAIVNSTPIPAFAEGTKGKQGSGMALVGEEGPEMTYLSHGTKVLTAETTANYSDVFDAMYDDKFDDWVMKNYMPQLLKNNKSESAKESDFINNLVTSFGKEDFNSDAVVDTLKHLDKKEDKRLAVLVNAIHASNRKRPNLRK